MSFKFGRDLRVFAILNLWHCETLKQIGGWAASKLMVSNGFHALERGQESFKRCFQGWKSKSDYEFNVSLLRSMLIQ